MTFPLTNLSRTVYLAACVVLVILWGHTGLASARSLAEIRRSGEIRFCMVPFHPSLAVSRPEGCREDCTYEGPGYDVVLAFVSTLGDVIPKFLSINWDNQFFNQDGQTVRQGMYTPALLASGTCDIYPNNVTRNAWRQKKLDFVTLFRSRMMIVVKKHELAQYQSAEHLAGKLTAVVKDTSFHTWLQAQNHSAYAHNPVRIVLVDNLDEGLNAVETGRADFTMMDGDSAIWATRHQFKASTMAFAVGPVDHIGWAFRKTDDDLQAAVQAFFADQKAQPGSKINKIWKKAFGVTVLEFEAIIDSSLK